MPIVGFAIKSLEGNRTGEPTASLQINSTPLITNVREADLASLSKKALVAEFEFKTSYEPDIGSIKITGEVLYLAQDNEATIDFWKKNKELPGEMGIEIINALFRKCLIMALNISDDLQLPAPIKLPFVAPKDTGKK